MADRLGHADVLGALHARGDQRAVPDQPGQGPDRAVGGVRPAHADRLRPRRARRPRARSARSACPSPTSATWSSCSTASTSARMNTSMTINASASWLLALYIANAEASGRRPPRACRARRRTTSSRSTCPAGTYIFPPEAEPAADRRHDRLHRARRAAVEPDQRVQLPPAGGGGDARAGAGVRPRHRHRRARRRARQRSGGAGRLPRRSSGASASSSTPASASSRRCARCGRSPPCGTASARDATASPIPSCAASATACR